MLLCCGIFGFSLMGDIASPAKTRSQQSGSALSEFTDDRSWPLAAPDVCDSTSAVGESRHRIPGASIGQLTEPCLGKCAACGPPYVCERTQAARAALVRAARQPISAARAVPRRPSSPTFPRHRQPARVAPPPAAPIRALEPRRHHAAAGRVRPDQAAAIRQQQ